MQEECVGVARDRERHRGRKPLSRNMRRGERELAVVVLDGL